MAVKSIREILGVSHPTYIGGGSDIMPLLKNHLRQDQNLVFLNESAELKGISMQGNDLFIGAGETLYDVATSKDVQQEFPALSQAAAAAASPQIRNIGTIGGNIMQDRRCIYFNQSRYWRSALPSCFKTGGSICLQSPKSPICRASYYSDLAAPLIVYEAFAECLEAGERTWVSVQELIDRHSLANGFSWTKRLPLLVLRFCLSRRNKEERSGFYKYAMRTAIDFPLINFALRCGGNGEAKIVAGAAAEVPLVLKETAKLLDLKNISDNTIITACEEEMKSLATPIQEACISPSMKRQMYRQIDNLLHLRYLT